MKKVRKIYNIPKTDITEVFPEKEVFPEIEDSKGIIWKLEDRVLQLRVPIDGRMSLNPNGKSYSIGTGSHGKIADNRQKA